MFGLGAAARPPSPSLLWISQLTGWPALSSSSHSLLVSFKSEAYGGMRDSFKFKSDRHNLWQDEWTTLQCALIGEARASYIALMGTIQPHRGFIIEPVGHQLCSRYSLNCCWRCYSFLTLCSEAHAHLVLYTPTSRLNQGWEMKITVNSSIRVLPHELILNCGKYYEGRETHCI